MGIHFFVSHCTCRILIRVMAPHPTMLPHLTVFSKIYNAKDVITWFIALWKASCKRIWDSTLYFKFSNLILGYYQKQCSKIFKGLFKIPLKLEILFSKKRCFSQKSADIGIYNRYFSITYKFLKLFILYFLA